MNFPVAYLLQSLALVITILSIWAYNRAKHAVLEDRLERLEEDVEKLQKENDSLNNRMWSIDSFLAVLRDRERKRPER